MALLRATGADGHGADGPPANTSAEAREFVSRFVGTAGATGRTLEEVRTAAAAEGLVPRRVREAVALLCHVDKDTTVTLCRLEDAAGRPARPA